MERLWWKLSLTMNYGTILVTSHNTKGLY
jgi:hypothetical protein